MTPAVVSSQEVQNGAGIQTAKATCKAKAAETYGL